MPFLCLWQCCRAGVQHWMAVKSCLLQMQLDSFSLWWLSFPWGSTSLAWCSFTGRCCVWAWSFTVFLKEWSQNLFPGHCYASVVKLVWKALFVFASVFINKALYHLFNIKTCSFFHYTPNLPAHRAAGAQLMALTVFHSCSGYKLPF